MSYADKIFKENCKQILTNGSTVPAARAKWEDGTPANTIKIFGLINRYDLSKEFPIMTLRPTGFKNCIDEILWIYQKKSNNVKELNSHIWDQWADINHTIGKGYGWQVGTKLRSVEQPVQIGEEKGSIKTNVDQTDYILNELKYNPYSRRILTMLYNIDDLDKMGLEPCAYSITFNVTLNKNGDKVLNAILNQRSQDMLVANNWNIVQYTVLVHLFAHVSNMQVGELVHVIGDAHIYDRHVSDIKKLIKRKEYDAPEFWINTEKTNFYDFRVDDFVLENYKAGKQIKNIPVAE